MLRKIILMTFLAIIAASFTINADQTRKWYFFNVGCDDAFEAYPKDYGDHYVWVVSNAFATADRDDSIEQFKDAMGAKYKTWTRCTINSHGIEGPYNTESEALKARRELLSNHRYNDEEVINFNFVNYD